MIAGLLVAHPLSRLVAGGADGHPRLRPPDDETEIPPVARRPPPPKPGIATLAGVLPLLLLNPARRWPCWR